MSPYGRAGRNAFRCGCGARVQVTATPVTVRRCTFEDCRTLATTKEPLRFCPDHTEEAATILAHAAGETRVRELEKGLGQTARTWNRRYGLGITPVPQNVQHAPVVYFARRERLIKIGWTSQLAHRMMSLATKPLATEPGDIVREQQLHRRFEHLRAAGPGREWFHPGPDLIAYIDDLRAAAGVPPLDRSALAVDRRIELKAYLAETTEDPAPRTLTQGGELLAGRMRMERFARTNLRPQVHAAVTGAGPFRGNAVAACARTRKLAYDAGGLTTASAIPLEDRCSRPPCRARWETLAD